MLVRLDRTWLADVGTAFGLRTPLTLGGDEETTDVSGSHRLGTEEAERGTLDGWEHFSFSRQAAVLAPQGRARRDADPEPHGPPDPVEKSGVAYEGA